jgi:hypothetical protein
MSRLRDNFPGEMGYSFDIKDSPLLRQGDEISLLERAVCRPFTASKINFEKREHSWQCQ